MNLFRHPHQEDTYTRIEVGINKNIVKQGRRGKSLP